MIYVYQHLLSVHTARPRPSFILMLRVGRPVPQRFLTAGGSISCGPRDSLILDFRVRNVQVQKPSEKVLSTQTLCMSSFLSGNFHLTANTSSTAAALPPARMPRSSEKTKATQLTRDTLGVILDGVYGGAYIFAQNVHGAPPGFMTSLCP